MKKINFKKALASVAALSVVACMAAIPASANEHGFGTASTDAAVTIEQITVTLDELAAANYQVPVMVKVNPNPGVNALEFGVKCDLEYTTLTKSKALKDYEDLATAGDSIADGLDATMTVKPSTVEPGLTWMTFAASDVDPDLHNFVTLLVTVPSDAKAGDEYPISYAAVGAGGASKNIFQVKENGSTTDYVENNNFTGVDGWIKIEPGATESSTSATTTSTSTTTTTTTSTTTSTSTSTTVTTTSASTTKATTTTATTTKATDTTTTTSTTPVTTTTTTTGSNAPATSTTANTTTGATTHATTTAKPATTTAKPGNSSTSTTSSPKTGASDVLPIAGAAAAVAILGGVALVAKKKND